MKKTSERIREAQSYIDTPDKWCKGYMHVYRDDGQDMFCSVGALENVGLRQKDVRMALARHFCEVLGFSHILSASANVGSFNDSIRTTHADVMVAFEKTAMEFEERGD